VAQGLESQPQPCPWDQTRQGLARLVSAGELGMPRQDLHDAERVCSLQEPQAFSPLEVSEMTVVFAPRPWALEGAFFRHAVGVAVVPALGVLRAVRQETAEELVAAQEGVPALTGVPLARCGP
jgi:hypothetical protein